MMAYKCHAHVWVCVLIVERMYYIPYAALNTQALVIAIYLYDLLSQP